MRRIDEQRTPEAQEARRLYNSRQYREGRKLFLAENPLCEWCRAKGRLVRASVVHHRIPHKNDETLFFDVDNWVALCAPCHDATAQQIERIGYSTEIGVDGFPIDPNHPANKT